MARYVIEDLDTHAYLMPRKDYWTRKTISDANNGDQTVWTPDINKARVFTGTQAAGNADKGGRKNIAFVEVTLSKVSL